MTLSTSVKGKINFRNVQIWLWVYLWKEKLTLDMSMYDFKYVEKVYFRHIHIWLWVCLSKVKLTLDMSKYDFKYVYQKKSWL
jgi:hypothetical protein